MPHTHQLMDGKVHVYRRESSSLWQCSTYLVGKNWRRSTGEESLERAKDIALDWYFDLRGKKHGGQLKDGRKFKEVAKKFLSEIEILTLGERNPRYTKEIREKLNLHLLPFFGAKLVNEITPGLALEYRIHRATSRRDKLGNRPIPRPPCFDLVATCKILVLKSVFETPTPLSRTIILLMSETETVFLEA